MTADKYICSPPSGAVAVVASEASSVQMVRGRDGVGDGDSDGGTCRGCAPRRAGVLASYLQLSFNTVFLATVLFLFFEFIIMVRNDVRHKLSLRLASDLLSMEVCRKNYDDNGCMPDTMVPALDGLCAHWAQCMDQDPEDLRPYQSGVLWAQTLAEIVNSFVEPISLRSILVILVTTCAILVVTNAAFKLYF